MTAYERQQHSNHAVPLPILHRVPQSRKSDDANKKLLETFKKVEVSIPLLDVIKQIPKYSKLVKSCVHTRGG